MSRKKWENPRAIKVMSTNCRRCHRQLRDAESIERGMGPICWHRYQFELNREDEQEVPLEFTGDIVCKRINGQPHVNIRQEIVRHSPAGFEWGYGGSGPADLALNILALFVDEDEASRLYQAFKWKFIATMPEEGGTIKREEILDWIQTQRRGTGVA